MDEKATTNADMIRNMGDEELGDFLCNICGYNSCDTCFFYGLCNLSHNGAKEWLSREADEDYLKYGQDET